MRDLVGRAEALSALTTTVGQCTKLPNVRTKVHNAIAVMSWKCFIESGNWTASLLDRFTARPFALLTEGPLR